MPNEFKVRKGLIVNGSGSTIFDVQGSQGQLFSITDSLSGSLFSVKDISGIPIMEVFSDNIVKIGTFNQEAIIVSGSSNRFGYDQTSSHRFTGSVFISSSLRVTGSINGSFTGSLFGTSSWSQNSQTASFVTASNVYGPFGSNSILSASYGATSSYAVTFNVSQSFTASGLKYPTADNGEESFIQTDGSGTLSLQYVNNNL
jgi:hypothetical protein